MILHGNQRGGAQNLALHLQKTENERVEIFEIRGFVSDTLDGAFQESYAISKGTKCKQHLYSLAISPPKGANISNEQFVEAANRAEKRLGLSGQPRAIVFHEKRGHDGELRRHAHSVWCRIDPDTMTAKQMSFDKEKLREVSRELHIEHDLKMPPGLINSKDRSPKNFTLAEWQQCKRAEKDPAAVKGIFQDCWAMSDSEAAFKHALEERGYFLAQGRRGHVAVDFKGEKYPVSRYVGIKAKDVRARLGEADGLPSLEQAQEGAAAQVATRLKELQAAQERELKSKRRKEQIQKDQLQEQQNKDTEQQRDVQQQRVQAEEQERQTRLRGGLWGLWDRVTGKRKQTEQQNELEAAKARERDRQETERLAQEQQRRQQELEAQAAARRLENEQAAQELQRDIEKFAPEPAHNPPQQSYAEQRRAEAARAREMHTHERPGLER